jgi:putative phosphoesterase
MRILLISDIHANWSALQAVQESFDVCLCMGDLVEYGPEPGRVIAWVRDNAAHCVRGNHDHGTAQNVDIVGMGGYRYLTMATRTATIRMLNRTDRHYLGNLPTTALATIGGKRFLLVHGSPRDPLDEYVPGDPALWGPRISGWNVDYVCVGHTHQQFSILSGKTTIINPGSLGLQRDGAICAKYAILDDDKVELKQIPYDVEATTRAVHAADFDPKAKQMLCDVYRTGRLTAQPANSNPSNQHPAPTIPTGVRSGMMGERVAAS